MDVFDLAARVRAGDRRALARALTAVENRGGEGRALVIALYPHSGQALVVGVTGPPGVGKSTLVDALAARARRKGRRVAVLAIDPTSPLTGGAVLGDRARMEAGSRDPEVFIRSMATRGHVGGLSDTAFEAITLLDAAGRELILLETVGVGQDEVEVAAAAGVTVVVLAPGLGDEVQASKAGLLEIADLLVVNKADREGADRVVAELEAALSDAARRPSVQSTVAIRGEGVDGLLDAIETAAGRDLAARRRKFLDGWLKELLCRAVLDRARGEVWDGVLGAVEGRAVDPFTAAEKLLAEIR